MGRGSLDPARGGVVVAADGDSRRWPAPVLLGALEASLQGTARTVAPRAQVMGRIKSTRSTLQKMRRRRVSAREIHDRLGLRVLVDEVPECFAVLQAVHGRWDHVPALEDDYIERPKPNGYRSLHTTLVGPSGLTFEVQIRTREMQEACERGPAAHWRYKASIGEQAGRGRQHRRRLSGRRGGGP